MKPLRWIAVSILLTPTLAQAQKDPAPGAAVSTVAAVDPTNGVEVNQISDSVLQIVDKKHNIVCFKVVNYLTSNASDSISTGISCLSVPQAVMGR